MEHLRNKIARCTRKDGKRISASRLPYSFLSSKEIAAYCAGGVDRGITVTVTG